MSHNKFIKGALGISKSLMNINTNDELSKKRLNICRKCDKLEIKYNKEKCSVCGCYLKHKTRIKSETCPLNKWE